MTKLTTALASTMFFGLYAHSALAVEPAEFMERFETLLAQQGNSFEFGSIEGDASSFTVSGLTINGPGGSESLDIPLTSITINNIDENANGTFTAQTVQVADIDVTQDKSTVKVTGVSMAGLELPEPDESNFVFYKNFSIKTVDVGVEGTQVFQMRDATFDLDGNPERTELTGNMAIPSINIDLSDIRNDASRKILSDMGYLQLDGSMGMDMTWDSNSGLMNLIDYFIDFDEVGRLTSNITIDGYTADFAKQLGQIAQNTNQQAAGMAMMGLLQQLNYISASIKFEDDSVTHKVLDFQAAKQGTDRASLIGLAKAVLPFSMAQLNKPEFTQKVTAAVGAFLENPESIEVTAKPSKPVPFFELATTGGAQPQKLIDLLEVDIKANQ